MNTFYQLIISIFLILVLSFEALGQIVFEEGYFIDKNDKKTVCLVKNHEWKNSPTQIEYKLANNSEVKVATIDSIVEFGVLNYKYIRFTGDIDQSGESLSNLSKNRYPEFSEETIFLRIIIEGSGSLYVAGKEKRYFYSLPNSKPTQLIYKEYLSNTRVLTNNTFKSQLWESLKCEGISLQDIEKTGYNKADLVKLFEKFNACLGVDYTNFYKKNKKVGFSLTIRPGLKAASLSIYNSQNSSQDIDFGNEMSFSFGLEAALILPFNKNKWAVTFEPTFQYYKAEDPRPNYSNSVNYQSIELPLGIKYRIFLSKQSELFLTAAVVVLDIPFNSSIGSLDLNSTNNLNFGLGYCFKNKYSIELRYGSPRRLLSRYALYTSNYQSLSIILGYNFF